MRVLVDPHIQEILFTGSGEVEFVEDAAVRYRTERPARTAVRAPIADKRQRETRDAKRSRDGIVHRPAHRYRSVGVERRLRSTLRGVRCRAFELPYARNE